MTSARLALKQRLPVHGNADTLNIHRRLLIQAVARTHKNNRQKAIEAFDNMSLLQMQTTLVEALSALQSGSPDERIPKLSSEPYMFIAVWWVTWSIPVSLVRDFGPIVAPLLQFLEVQDML